MKKIILTLIGITLVLIATIYIIYKNNEESNIEEENIFENQEEPKENQNPISDKVTVDIKGMIQNPGVYEVPKTSRVNDVIILAGGLLEGADTSYINLAKLVEDEMTIIIYSNEEIKEKYLKENCICEKCEINNDACLTEDKSSKQININTATIEEIKTIDGLGESKARSIIQYREENGPFKTIEEIKNVSGIGEALFEKIKDYITV